MMPKQLPYNTDCKKQNSCYHVKITAEFCTRKKWAKLINCKTVEK